jgi:protein involved in polysaccharide export with SLBB domain
MMRNNYLIIRIICLSGLLGIFPFSAHSADTVDSDYKVGPGEVLSVTFYRENDLNQSKLRVPANGKYKFPLIGELEITGKSTDELEIELSNRYKDGYLKHPKIMVRIMEYRPFFVNGAVNAPGKHAYVEGLTVRKAISLAGGLSERASERKITLIRYQATDEESVSAKLDSVLIMPGDIVTVGESLF